ncbi:MAG: iron-containing alcohol dehydrogenase [Eubacterium sp.]
MDNTKFINQFKDILTENNPDKILFVSSREYDRFGYRKAIDDISIKSVAFCDFEPCPEVSSVKKGMELYKKESCDFIVTVGGGSAIDVAKAIKYYLEEDIKILAVPTTAGTGAEVTRFAVIYENADKASVRSYDIIPEFAVFDSESLETLPRFQRIVTSLDAFSHALEAYWSINATDESRKYSIEALRLFNEGFFKYLDDDKASYEIMMKCSELAGRAINIAQTTAAHAFSYKLHKLKGFAHGQAVAVCLAYIWQYMLDNSPSEELNSLLKEVEEVSSYNPDTFKELLNNLGLCDDLTMTKEQFDETVHGVNIQKLQNHPMEFSQSDIEKIYSSFLKKPV